MTSDRQQDYKQLTVTQDTDDFKRFEARIQRRDAFLAEIEEVTQKTKLGRDSTLREIDVLLSKRATLRSRKTSQPPTEIKNSAEQLNLEEAAEARALAQKKIDELNRAKRREELRARKELDLMISSQYESGIYRAMLEATRLDIKAQEEEKFEEKTEEAKTLAEYKKTRSAYLEAITKYKIDHHPGEDGYSSYYSWLGHNYLGLLSESLYCWPYMLEMVEISVLVFQMQVMKIKEPSMDQVSFYSNIMTVLIFAANVLGYDAKGDAVNKIKAALDDPTKSLWGLMKQHPLLAFCMLKHFIDGGYSEVMQLADKLGWGIYIVGPIAIYAATSYYIPQAAEKILKAGEKWQKHDNIIKDFFISLWKCDFRKAGADFYIGLLHLLTNVYRSANFGFCGYKEVTQLPYFVPQLKDIPDSKLVPYAYGSAVLSAVTTYPASDNSRGISLREQFHNTDMTAEQYQIAEAKYNSRSTKRKLGDEWLRLTFSPSTFINIPIMYFAVESFESQSYGAGFAYSTLAALFHLCYREARRLQDITSIATKLGKEDAKIEPNWLNELCALLLASADQLSRVGSGAVAVLTLVLGDYFSKPDVAYLQQAPQGSMDLLLCIYCFGAVIAAGNMPFSLETIQTGVLGLSHSLFGTRRLLPPTAPKELENHSEQSVADAGDSKTADRKEDAKDAITSANDSASTIVVNSTRTATSLDPVYDEDEPNTPEPSSWWNCFSRRR